MTYTLSENATFVAAEKEDSDRLESLIESTLGGVDSSSLTPRGRVIAGRFALGEILVNRFVGSFSGDNLGSQAARQVILS